jgi:hypothetical protein
MNYLAETTFSIPVGWALGSFMGMATLVGGLGRIIYGILMLRIQALEKEVARLSRGCGMVNCHWRINNAPALTQTD